MLRRKCRKYITFSVPSGKKLYNGKTIAYKLIVYLKLTTENVGTKVSHLSVILLDLKIINYIINVKNLKRKLERVNSKVSKYVPIL